MRTTDLFNFNRSSKRLNESLEKTFGTKINFEAFDTPQLEDSRNKLRTQIHTARGQSGFNETIENEALTKAQFIHDAIVAELMDREEHIVDTVVDEDEDVEESAPPTAKGERMVKHIKKGYADDGKLTDKEKSIAYATAWKAHNKNEAIQTELSTNTLKSYQDKAGKEIVHTMTSGDHMTTDKSAKKVMNRMKGSEKADNKIWKKNESINTGDDMRNLREGEIQQASAIVTAKTMVDRVGRWIEELSGMENETLLQLGDSIRDEMGQEQAKAFIEAVAPAIQAALDNLKTTRDTLSTGVRSLASGEAPEGMLGAEPEMGGEAGMDMAEPDMMNEPDMEMGGEEDAFAAAEPGAGGMETSGREQRESIDRQSRLMKILAG